MSATGGVNRAMGEKRQRAARRAPWRGVRLYGVYLSFSVNAFLRNETGPAQALPLP